MYIINNEIRSLVRRLDAAEPTAGALVNGLIAELVRKLTAACARPDVSKKYADYRANIIPGSAGLKKMPLDARGYLRSFDPLTEEAEFVAAWQEYGIVASRGAVAPDLCEAAIQRIANVSLALHSSLGNPHGVSRVKHPRAGGQHSAPARAGSTQPADPDRTFLSLISKNWVTMLISPLAVSHF